MVVLTRLNLVRESEAEGKETLPLQTTQKFVSLCSLRQKKLSSPLVTRRYPKYVEWLLGQMTLFGSLLSISHGSVTKCA